MKRVSVTLTDDLFMHLEALRMYYDYPSRSEVIRKALDDSISKHSSSEVFDAYVSGAREIMRDMEGDQ
ncbi:hypothetical protein [Streptococcus rubneri]|jgi:metal-responsive CopG/Arc/MetJ family transcriptional regulator|uniref:hypothetical protein n=1 Tax=Streptococcus rubneri TaxID=1234680 RepID=UPI00189ED19F|nr:hypothetical protein [Streptococcus rubneri]